MADICDLRRYDGGRESLIQGPTIEMRLPWGATAQVDLVSGLDYHCAC
jgi:hypothetical protein